MEFILTTSNEVCSCSHVVLMALLWGSSIKGKSHHQQLKPAHCNNRGNISSHELLTSSNPSIFWPSCPATSLPCYRFHPTSRWFQGTKESQSSVDSWSRNRHLHQAWLSHSQTTITIWDFPSIAISAHTVRFGIMQRQNLPKACRHWSSNETDTQIENKTEYNWWTGVVGSLWNLVMSYILYIKETQKADKSENFQ